jgi:predicted small metal-binding protein
MFHAAAEKFDHYLAAKLYPSAFRRQRFANVSPTLRAENGERSRRRQQMAQVIKCECGYVVRGESESELLELAGSHVRESHPDLVGKITDEDLLAMAEVE